MLVGTRIRKRIGNTHVSPWRLTEEKYKRKDGSQRARFAIRRWISTDEGEKINERYPSLKFRQIAAKKEQLEKLVERLNEEEFRDIFAYKNILKRNAFLNESDLEAYFRHLQTRIPSAEKARNEFSTVKRHVINFFVGKLGIYDPADWYKRRQDYMEFILGVEAPPAARSKKKVVQVANRFMKWLHEERPLEIPQVVFPQPSRAMLRAIQRKTNVESRKRGARTYIPDHHWEKIKKALPDNLRPWIMLCYHYGLRRAEALGLTYKGTDSVYESHLLLERQLRTYDYRTDKAEYDLLKTPGRISEDGEDVEKREIPHWMATPEEAYQWIHEGQKYLMHPDTLTHRWDVFIKGLELDYTIHELRHTWITKSRRKHKDRDVQLAAGHTSILTTERYSHDDREFEKKIFRPNKMAS